MYFNVILFNRSVESPSDDESIKLCTTLSTPYTTITNIIRHLPIIIIMTNYEPKK